MKVFYLSNNPTQRIEGLRTLEENIAAAKNWSKHNKCEPAKVIARDRGYPSYLQRFIYVDQDLENYELDVPGLSSEELQVMRDGFKKTYGKKQ